jgi:hypothetical protein
MMAQDPPVRWRDEKQLSTSMGACDKEGKGSKAIATSIRVEGNEEGKCNKEGNGIGNKGLVR